jgi:hypothetical protein
MPQPKKRIVKVSSFYFMFIIRLLSLTSIPRSIKLAAPAKVSKLDSLIIETSVLG